MNRLPPLRHAPWLLSAFFVLACAKTELPEASPATGTGQLPGPQPAASSAPIAAPQAATPAPSDGAPFPLVRGSRYTFEGEFGGQKSAVELELRAVEVGGEQAFYFADLESSTDLVAPAFGLGVFVLRADGLYTADVLQAANISQLERDEIKRMMALPVVVGGSLAVSTPAKSFVPGRDDTYRVEGIETVTVPAGTFAGCVRLATDSVIDGERESAKVWLAPGVGPVKLLRGTGRVDQLTKFTRGR